MLLYLYKRKVCQNHNLLIYNDNHEITVNFTANLADMGRDTIGQYDR